MGTTWSSRAWTTRVGVRTFFRTSTTSTLARASISFAAFSGEVVFRQSSLNQLICSAVAPGTKREVKTCRNAGLSFPQPNRARSMMAW